MLYEKGFTLVFEASQGCSMGCTGCQINKNLSGLPDKNKFDELLALFVELKQQNQTLVELEIGPTDMISAKNRKAIFTHPNMLELVRLFDMTTINASFVYDNDQAYVELAQDVNALNKTSNNSLQIPVNLKHLYKEHYIELIERNLAVYQSHLDSPLTEVLFSVIIDDAMLGNVGSDINYSVLHERTKKLRSKGYGFDFVSHQGLKDLHVESVRKDFIRAMRKFNAGFANLGQETSSMRRFGTLKDFRESMELVFHEGDLYVRPTMSERPNIFHEQMLYTGPWNALDLLTHSMMRFNRNLEIGSSLHDCHDCMRITDCSKRFVHDVMSILKTEECLISLKKVLQPA